MSRAGLRVADLVIEAVGRAIRVWVNGDLVNDGSEATADRGRIALQSEGSEVEFRTLTLTPITKLTVTPAPETQSVRRLLFRG